MAIYSLTVPNKVGSYDGDMVVKQYTSLTINSGNTLTTDQPCRGLFIYVQGDCTINGNLSMTARGASADPTTSGGSDASIVNATGIRYGFWYSGGTDTLTMSGSEFNGCGTNVKSALSGVKSGTGNNYKVVTIPRTGAAATSNPTSPSARVDGNNGANGQTGSGGSGQVGDGGTGGAGGAGTCFSGGAGGGGSRGNAGAAGSSTGGAGGGAGNNGCGACSTAGGAGNPGTGGGSSGTGGLLYLVVGGNLTIGATGVIESRGSTGGTATGWCGSCCPGESAGGGGSGGGSIVVLYRGTLTNNGSIVATGGSGGVSCSTNRGGNGGNGTVQIFQVR